MINSEVYSEKEVKDIREVFEHEASDFTPWLSEEENINALGEKLGINIKVIGREKTIGGLRVDILAQNEETDRPIIIENQLEKTDDDHFIRALKYAAGVDAETIIWIAPEITDEIKVLVDWLINKNINIYLVQIKLYKINNNYYMVTYEVKSEPNNWVKNVKSETDEVYKEYELSSTKKLQKEYWDMLKQEIDKNYADQLNSRKTGGQPWYNLGLNNGFPDEVIDLIFNVRDSFIRAGIYIPKDKDLFNHLYKNKEQIESEIGFELTWYNKDGNKSSKFYIEKDVDVHNKNNWDEYINWQLEKACKFKKVFSEKIKKFKSEKR